MITGTLRNDVDKLWEEFWTGGITNPLTVIEQISFLMFARMLDITETREEKKAQRTKKKDWHRIFPEKMQNLRWCNFKELGGAEMLPLVGNAHRETWDCDRRERGVGLGISGVSDRA